MYVCMCVCIYCQTEEKKAKKKTMENLVKNKTNKAKIDVKRM